MCIIFPPFPFTKYRIHSRPYYAEGLACSNRLWVFEECLGGRDGEYDNNITIKAITQTHKKPISAWNPV